MGEAILSPFAVGARSRLCRREQNPAGPEGGARGQRKSRAAGKRGRKRARSRSLSEIGP